MCSAMYGQALQQPLLSPIYVSCNKIAKLVHVATTQEAVEAAERMKDDPAASESARRTAADIDYFVERKVASEL